MSEKKPYIIFTGGGTLGHVIPNIVLIDELAKEGWRSAYIGSKKGPEKEVMLKKEVPYFGIPTGKLRRYFSFQNLLDIFNVLGGIFKAFFILLKERPNVVFSKGGFVSFPVVFAAWLNRIPVIVHESDLTPGLTSKLSAPFASKVCISFSDTAKWFKKDLAQFTGLPIRPIIYSGNAKKGLQFTGLSGNRKIILVFGGSQGSSFMNELIRNTLDANLLEEYDIINVCGKGNMDASINSDSYKQYEYLSEEFPDVMAAADLVICRGGSTSLFELIAQQKLHIVIPLSKKASRGDQIENAKYFHEQGITTWIEEETCTPPLLAKEVKTIFENEQAIIQKIKNIQLPNTVETLVKIIRAYQ